MPRGFVMNEEGGRERVSLPRGGSRSGWPELDELLDRRCVALDAWRKDLWMKGRVSQFSGDCDPRVAIADERSVSHVQWKSDMDVTFLACRLASIARKTRVRHELEPKAFGASYRPNLADIRQ